MNEENRTFAEELIKLYGADRFYHCSLRTSNADATAELYMGINATEGKNWRETSEECVDFLKSLSIVPSRPPVEYSVAPEHQREDLCRIAFGFCRYWRELGLKTYKLPMPIHARMVLGETNSWVKNYNETIRMFSE